MENFINNDTIIKDNIYNNVKDLILCPICQNILIEPVMCMKCQKSFCKKCVDKLTDVKCPNNCEQPNFQKSISKNEILIQLKFKCKYCKDTMSYGDALKHKNICNTELIQTYEIIEDYPSIPKNNKKKIEKLTPEQMGILKKDKDVIYMNSKK